VTKRALEVADQIESSVCDLGWAVGEMVGDEAALMARLDVGRSVFRQAIRLSEHLGVAAMRRGRTGGLVVAKPNEDPAALSLQIAWSKQGVQRRAVERLQTALDSWALTGPRGSKTFLDVTQRAAEGFSGKQLTTTAMDAVKLGERIAQSILETLIDQRWVGPDLLGSEARLMDLYGAGRASLREAVHLLELHGVAVMQRGPGGGLLVLRAPSPGAIPRSVRAQLRSSGLSDMQIRTLMQDFIVAVPGEDVQDAGLVLRHGAQQIIDFFQLERSQDQTPSDTSIGRSVK
jgi:DNA-binding FadR family transcriptional regulator